ncbi:hypothetical protein F511_00147 [Dorcoceras hygrometricum]|uniref:Uncharacterized protein n=1 Tax=Dorcoceras hygrometricum TaxID=472368 RepID=A0A2Z7AIX1_9LAMI|nr:hypothetical protein F511_16369 [Dorcoceras hygrometricum]KZV53881.1 hypothetical protein F511_00147 [Dorcoceras hygrometricum]
MEITPFSGSLKKQWSSRGYNHNYSFKLSSSSTNRRSLKTAKFGGHTKQSPEVFLSLPAGPSPQKLWRRMKNCVFGSKKVIPEARSGPPMANSRTEFENRLFLEIYKSTASSLELGYTPSVAN